MCRFLVMTTSSDTQESARAILKCVDALQGVSSAADDVASAWGHKVLPAQQALEALCSEEAEGGRAPGADADDDAATIDELSLPFGAAVQFALATPAFVDAAATAGKKGPSTLAAALRVLVGEEMVRWVESEGGDNTRDGGRIGDAQQHAAARTLFPVCERALPPLAEHRRHLQQR